LNNDEYILEKVYLWYHITITAWGQCIVR